MNLTVGSLFSGIGGIDLAFQQAGFDILWAVEKDSACCKTYSYNFPEINLMKKDVRLIDSKLLTKVNVIAAGFPCQAFSIAGNQRGFSDTRGTLFYDLARIIKDLRPDCIFLENVPNLMDHDNGKTFLVIHSVLSELGYSIRYKVMRASEYGGIPQIRDRIYIVAFKQLFQCDVFEYPEKIPLSTDIERILERNKMKQKVYYYNENNAFYSKVKNIVLRRDSIYRVYHDSIKLIQNNMCPTLTASMGIQENQVPLIIDDFGLRKLTVQECLDFQGFSTKFHFPNTITINDAYKQVGNSVCVPVVNRIAEQIKHVMK